MSILDQDALHEAARRVARASARVFSVGAERARLVCTNVREPEGPPGTIGLAGGAAETLAAIDSCMDPGDRR